MRIHHLALRVSDCERAAEFYSSVLGLPERRRLLADDGALRAIWLEADGVLLMLERALRGGDGAGSGHLLAFAVEDLNDWERRLVASRIPVEDRTAHTLYVRDPDGHRVGLSAYRG